MRLQLALNVSDIDAAVAYYSRLFATAPHKRRPGYANFAIDDPALKLVLFEVPGAQEHLNHIGVEVLDPGQMPGIQKRLADNDILARVVDQSTCCHATQDKLWSDGPDGLNWEWYTITDDAPQARPNDDTCCASDAEPARQTPGNVCCT
ncbi:ArsI/CadI family heavy metal resistance metalloenzyme [Pacificispira sp.]|uniref:ArsI/CadI family heavy metal resistance metalloenzyme n=1 Tax=Pacificispira sp. TaxID=2888761 RepID=UPI003BA9A036